MNILVVTSALDAAGVLFSSFIQERIRSTTSFGSHVVNHLEVLSNSTHAQIPDTGIDLVVFATKHDSKSGKKTFCVHTQGNWGVAQLGGSASTVGICPVVFKQLFYRTCLAHPFLDFDLIHEATHHGPDLAVPSVFIEVGSTLAEWTNSEAVRHLFEMFNQTLLCYEGEKSAEPVIMGIGGPHACTNFASLNSCVLLGHVVPSYAVLELTRPVLVQAMQKHTLPVQLVVDWKSLASAQRKHVIEVLGDLPWVKLSEFKDRMRS